MNRCVYLFVMAAALAMPVQAYDWPWQEEREVRYGFCKGFIMAGLSESNLGDNSRIDLWLTWNYILRAELPEGSITEEDFQQGRDHLDSLAASGDYHGIRQVADDECYLGRNRRHGHGSEEA